MNTTIKIVLLPILFFITISSFAQKTDKQYDGKFIGRIYTGFYHSFNNEVTPQTGFDFTTGIFGYTHKLSDKVKATLLYDVTRTTNIRTITASSGDTIILDYFEGSKYTAFLKMAQIDWQITDKLGLSVGQLLNQQYLTVQDKWWGFRYIRVTFQEAYRYGMPADFGARINYEPIENLSISLSAVNGEGPFRYQDENSNFLFSTNIEYYPVKNLLIKVYIDNESSSMDNNEIKNKNIVSGFIGYKTKKIMLGLETNSIINKDYINDNNFEGFSLYSSYALSQKFTVLGRLDYGNFATTDNSFYAIGGFQYKPEKNFFTAITYRMSKIEGYEELIPQININFAANF